MEISQARMAALIIALFCISAFSGCSNSGNAAVDTQQPRDSSQFGNISPEQRQQMMEERTRAAINACNGLSAGDDCTMENPRGSLTGICSDQEGTLSCRMQDMRRINNSNGSSDNFPRGINPAEGRP